MRRKVKIYAGGNPAALAKQSEAAIMYAFADMKEDILKMAEALRVIGYPKLGIDPILGRDLTNDLYDSDNAYKYVRDNFSLEDLEYE